MSYEYVQRAVAYLACLSAVSLFATSMAIAAVNVGKTVTGAASLHAEAAYMQTAKL